MSNGVQVRLEGGESLLAALRQMDANVKTEVRRAVSAGAEIVQDAARALAPGPAIETEVVSATAQAVIVDIGPDAEHWYYRFHETGAAAHEISGNPYLAFEGREGMVVTAQVNHPGFGARPFLRPAMDANEGAATNRVGDVLREAVQRARA